MKLARLGEDQALELLSLWEVEVPAFTVVESAPEAKAAAEVMEREVILKSLVAGEPAGTIRFAKTPDEAQTWAGELLGKTAEGRRAERLLVIEKVEGESELYLSFNLDVERRKIVVTVSADGGLDYADLVEERPESLHRVEVLPGREFPEYLAREVWAATGLNGATLLSVAALTRRLYQSFVQYDVTFLELNPLVVTEYGEVVPGGASLWVDDAALARQPDLAGWVDDPGPAAGIGTGVARFTELDREGDLGFLGGWGAAGLAAFDAVLAAGGRPANYAEFGLATSETQFYGLAKVVLAQPGLKGLFVGGGLNLEGAVDAAARGILRAIQELKLDLRAFPVVVRQPGVNEQAARQLWEGAGAEWHGDDLTLEEAAAEAVRRVLAAGGPTEGGRH